MRVQFRRTAGFSTWRWCRNGVVTLNEKGALHARTSSKQRSGGVDGPWRRRIRQSFLSRRRFLEAAALAVSASCDEAGGGIRSGPPENRVQVGAHPWVYAATQPGYDIYPILDRIFADVAYAGIEELELMHTALHPSDSVERIRALIDKHRLPVIGTSYSGAMWDRGQHAELLKESQTDHPPTREARRQDPGHVRRGRSQGEDGGAARRSGRAAPQADQALRRPRHRAQPPQSHLRGGERAP